MAAVAVTMIAMLCGLAGVVWFPFALIVPTFEFPPMTPFTVQITLWEVPRAAKEPNLAVFSFLSPVKLPPGGWSSPLLMQSQTALLRQPRFMD